MIYKQDIQAFREKRRILLKGNEYLYILPHPNLRDYVSNYTITFPTKEIMSDRYTIMPHASATLVVSSDGMRNSVELFGPAAKPFLVGYNPAEMLVIIEFQPAGLYALTGISQSELTDKTISFEAVNPALCKLVSEIVEKSGSVHELAAGLDILLLENMYTAYHPQLQLALGSIINCAGNISARKLSGDIYYSERQLNRIFEQFVGMSAKSFSKLVRLNKACRLLEDTPGSITSISSAAGYHDLPHFIHDFKSLCGITPQEYRHNMSDFYSAIAKFLKYT